MTTDLTKGSPIRQILWFSVPYLIGNLFQQFYNIADMVIVGQTLDPNAYTAVGATSSLVWFASGAIQSLTAGFSAIAARYFGSRDEEMIKRSFAASIRLSAVITAILTLICVVFARPFLELLQTPDDIIDRSYRYIICIFAGLFVTALFNLLSNMIRSLGDSKTPLYFLVIACVINIILDFVFIAVLGMDTEGAGLATIIAQLISGILCIVYIVKKQPLLHIAKRHFKNDKILDITLLKIGLPMAFLNMVLSVGAIIVQFATNNLGTLYVSAYVTASKLETFVTQPLLSFGSAVSVFAAQNYGAGKYSRVIEGARKTQLIGYAWCAIASIIMIPLGRFLILLLNKDIDPIVVDNAYKYIVINTVLVFTVSPLIICKSVLQAVGRTTFSMISGFTEIFGRAGLSIAVVCMMKPYLIGRPDIAPLLSEPVGFTVMCFATPLAWLFGTLTVIGDYILMIKKFKKMQDTPDRESKSEALVEELQ